MSLIRKEGVVFLLYLPERFFGSTFQFVFYHIAVIEGFQHLVYAAFRGVIIRLRIEAYDLEDNQQRIFFLFIECCCMLL